MALSKARAINVEGRDRGRVTTEEVAQASVPMDLAVDLGQVVNVPAELVGGGCLLDVLAITAGTVGIAGTRGILGENVSPRSSTMKIGQTAVVTRGLKFEWH